MPSHIEVEAPACLGNMATRVRFSLVPVALCLLLGKDFIAKFKPVIDPDRMRLRIGRNDVRLVRSANDHMAFELAPSAWPTLRSSSTTRAVSRDTAYRQRQPRTTGGKLMQVLAIIASATKAYMPKPTPGEAPTRADVAIALIALPASADGRSTAHCLQTVSTRSYAKMCHICGMGAKSCCTFCGGYACRGCREGVVCTMCLHGGRGFDSMEEVLEPQVQEHRQMKRGTAKLNQHGLRLAATLHDNGVHPRLVRNKLLCDSDTKATNVCRAAVQGTRREKTMPLVLHEYGT